MSRAGHNPDRNRFNLIMSEVYNSLNFRKYTHPEFVAKCFEWVEPFKTIWDKEHDNNEYASWLFYCGITTIKNSQTFVDALQDKNTPYGLPNNDENRKSAAICLKKNFGEDAPIDDCVKRLINYLSSNHSGGFIKTYTKNVKNVNMELFGAYIRNTLIPAIIEIDDLFETLAGILIYAQSGAIPSDVFKLKLESERENSDLQMKVSKKERLNIYNSQYHELSDKNFYGKFYGYFRQHRDKNDVSDFKGIAPFTLSIEEKEDTGVMAKISFSRYSPQLEEAQMTMTGKPMMIDQTVHIIFQAEDGEEIITMSYKWRSIKNNNLQCRFGVILTINRGATCPQLQKFIFFNSPIPSEYEKYVDAFLSFADTRLAIPESCVSKLTAEESNYLKEYGNKTTAYILDIEDAIKKSRSNDLSGSQIVKNILGIKKQSFNQLVIDSDEDILLSDFFRSLLKAENLEDDNIQQNI